MLDQLGRIGGAVVIGMGLAVAVTEPAIVPASYSAGIESAGIESAGIALSATVLAMGGLGYETLEPDTIARVLGGRYADEQNLVGLPWPGELTPFNGTLTLAESVAVGLETMDTAIRTTPGVKIVAGASGSTLVVNEMMRRLGDDLTAPPKDELSFVVLGDADRGVFKQLPGVTLPIIDYPVQPIPVTKYDVLVVAGEYDGLGDWPDRPWNLLAVVNALAGTGLLQQVIHEDIVDALGLEAFGSVHYDAMFADLTVVPERNITTTVNRLGGVTTSYLVPTPDLPMLRPLKTMGVPQDVIDTLEKGLRPIIDSAYERNDPFRLERTARQSVAMASESAIASESDESSESAIASESDEPSESAMASESADPSPVVKRSGSVKAAAAATTDGPDNKPDQPRRKARGRG